MTGRVGDGDEETLFGPSAGVAPAANGMAVSDDAIVALVGREAFARALVAVRSGHVSHVETDLEARTVSGHVRGSHRDDYAVTVFLSDSPAGTTTVHRSRCSCPVTLDCKHAAAVLVVARHRQAPAVAPAPWEQALEPLLAPPLGPSADEVSPLALELGIERIPANRGYAGRLDLRMRPLRRGRSGSWVRSGIAWDDLDFVVRSCVAPHRELLLQLRAATGSSARHALARNAWLSLQGVSSAFWSLLAQASEVGLEIATEAPMTMLDGPGVGTVTLDVRRVPGSGLLVAPRVELDHAPVELSDVGVLGDPVHGVFGLGADGGLRLGRLDGVLPRELRSLVVGARPLLVPDADEPRFLREFVPALRRHTEVACHDGSVVLPGAVEPRLALEVRVRDEQRLRLDWSYRYATPEGDVDFGVGELPMDSVRDPVAESLLLARLNLPLDELPALGSAAPDGRLQLAPHALLAGLGSAVFAGRLLPELRAQGVEIGVEGDLPHYRESQADPAVSVSATERVGTRDWFDLHVTVKLDGEDVPFDRLFVALSAGEPHLVLDGGLWFSLDRPVFDRLRGLIEESRELADLDSDELVLSRYQVSLWEDLVDLGVVGEQSARWSRTVRGLGAALPTDPDPADPDPSSGATGPGPVQSGPPPVALDAALRPYQQQGYAWLHFLWTHGLGGILADDMGLGKTLQTLALIAAARAEPRQDPENAGPGRAGPFLVVAPTSVVTNWLHEAARFAPGLTTVSLVGSASRRRDLSALVAGADLVVTSYALLRHDEEQLATLPWSGLVLDEAQFVKNHRSRTYRAARRLAPAFTLAITGTPLENSLMDLWSLLSLTAPGLFASPQRFSRYYRRPIERDRDPARLAQLHRRIRPFVLRRTKQEVATELPPKQEQVVEVELGPAHLRLYQTYLQRERHKVLGLVDDLDRNRFTILSSLTLLRRLSLDPALVDPSHDGVPAAKVDLLVDDLTELVAGGHQALVFSQFTTLLSRVRARLEAEGIAYAYLDGSTTRRDEVVEQFRRGEAPVFLISLKAGGFGLNLAEADYCFILDPWWNPATEAQAVDRAHRIGQARTLMVYRMVAKNTIEEKVMALKRHKAELFDAVFAEDALGGESLTSEDIKKLLDLY